MPETSNDGNAERGELKRVEEIAAYRFTQQ